MTDLDAIRARHVESHPLIPQAMRWCVYDKQPWPCDAHQLGVALEDCDVVAQLASIRIEAAEAREQRLRAALEEVLRRCKWADKHDEGIDPLPIVEMARAALATEAE